MLSYLNLARLKSGIWFRQVYTPGSRGAVMVLAVNILIILTIKVVTMRMAHEAMIHKKYLAKPVKRRLIPVNIFIK